MNQFASEKGDNIRQYQERLSTIGDDFDLNVLIHVTVKSIPWIVLFFILSGAGGYLIQRYTPPVYEAKEILQITAVNTANAVLKIENIYEIDLAHEIELLRSTGFVSGALSNLELGISYFAKGQILNFEQYLGAPYHVVTDSISPGIYGVPVFVSFPSNQRIYLSYTIDGEIIQHAINVGEKFAFPHFSIQCTIEDFATISEQQRLFDVAPYFFVINPPSQLGSYASKIDVQILNSAAQTIQVSYKDYNSAKAADIVNAIGKAFINYDVVKKAESANKVLTFIDDQLEAVYAKLRSTESIMQSYKVENKITDNQNYSGLLINRLDNYQNELVTLELDETVLNEIEKTFSENKDIDVYKLLPLLAGAKYESNMASLISSLQNLLRKKESSLYDITVNSEEMKSLNFQIEIQKKLIIESVKALKSKLILTRSSLTQKSKDIENKFYGLPAEELEYARLQRLFTINEKFYNMLLEKKAEYSISKAGFVSQNIILEEATAPEMPVSPDKRIIYAAAIAIGFILSIALVALRYLFHDTITSVYEITRLTSAPVLGVIPEYRKDIPVSQLLVDKNPKSILAEAFRSVRTNLQFVVSKPGPKIIAITSTLSGEGKTFLSINLAGIIAYSDKKVIVIDVDMRKPKIHLGFGVENDKGMSTILSMQTNIEDCIRTSLFKNLDFITAGPIPPNPSELVISSKMEELLAYLKKKYDYIIIDTPPVGIVTDGIAIIQKADYPIYIFKAGVSKKQFVHNVERLITDSHITNLAIILNSVDLTKSKYGYGAYGSGYGYGYGYGYNYGYGYYTEEIPKNSSGIRNIIKRFKKKIIF